MFSENELLELICDFLGGGWQCLLPPSRCWIGHMPEKYRTTLERAGEQLLYGTLEEANKVFQEARRIVLAQLLRSVVREAWRTLRVTGDLDGEGTWGERCERLRQADGALYLAKFDECERLLATIGFALNIPGAPPTPIEEMGVMENWGGPIVYERW